MKSALLGFMMCLPVVGQSAPAGWSAAVEEIRFPSSADQSEQPALFLPATGAAPRPLVVFLHQWGGDYLTSSGRPVARWCAEKNWNFLQPDFRGPNVRPEAMGSDLVLADVLDAVEEARRRGPVDASRIFLLGASGGGHAALLAASRHPGVFRAASVWVPISDLVRWHAECRNTSHHGYARNIEKACGGAPAPGSAAETEARRRSPLTHLVSARDTLFDINAGIHDGHGKNSVPVSHAFHAYNALVGARDRIAAPVIETITREQSVPADLAFSGTDPAYKDHPVLFRQAAANTRLTIFEGGHEMVLPAALAWLEEVAAIQDIAKK